MRTVLGAVGVLLMCTVLVIKWDAANLRPVILLETVEDSCSHITTNAKNIYRDRTDIDWEIFETNCKDRLIDILEEKGYDVKKGGGMIFFCEMKGCWRFWGKINIEGYKVVCKEHETQANDEIEDIQRKAAKKRMESLIKRDIPERYLANRVFTFNMGVFKDEFGVYWDLNNNARCLNCGGILVEEKPINEYSSLYCWSSKCFYSGNKRGPNSYTLRRSSGEFISLKDAKKEIEKSGGHDITSPIITRG